MALEKLSAPLVNKKSGFMVFLANLKSQNLTDELITPYIFLL